MPKLLLWSIFAGVCFAGALFLGGVAVILVIGTLSPIQILNEVIQRWYLLSMFLIPFSLYAYGWYDASGGWGDG